MNLKLTLKLLAVIIVYLAPALSIIILYGANPIHLLLQNTMWAFVFTTNIGVAIITFYIFWRTEQVAVLAESLKKGIKDFGMSLETIQPVLTKLKQFTPQDIEKIGRLIDTGKKMLEAWTPKENKNK